MTYHELLHSVSFDEIAPFIEKQAGSPVNLALYKTHYDMLRLLTPHREEGDNDTANVTNAELDYDWEEPHLNAYPLEGDLWEVSLAKELIIAPDVTASLAEIAACCLWHTSFYGFTQEQRRETFEKFDYYSKDLLDCDIVRIEASQKRQQIEAAGGYIPTKNEMLRMPSFRQALRKRLRHSIKHICKKRRRRIVRRRINSLYQERTLAVGEFVTACMPALSESKEMTLHDLCKLFYSNHFRHYSYQTYAGNAAERGTWMVELIEKYQAIVGSDFSNVMILITVSQSYPFSDNDRKLTDLIERMCSGKTAMLIKNDDTLGEELRMDVAFYEKNKLAKW